MPDFKPAWMLDQIREKTQVIYPGCWLGKQDLDPAKKDPGRPLIIWNHRWEHDKNPEFFFDALDRLKQKKISFSLALLGENFETVPAVFERAKERFKEEMAVCGYVESREEYISWLKKGAVVVSCALQENFGISVIEAIRFGCLPLLPDRLSYPELIPGEFFPEVLYQSMEDLVIKLEDRILNYHKYIPLQNRLSESMELFSWEIAVKQYDNILKKLKKILD